jgi:O-antigen/teichoic acid export membrane protein
MMNFLRKLTKQPVLLFTASRYTSYGILFLRGLLIAKYLGPSLFGVWGFLTLAQQYLSYTSFGLQYAITVELSTTSKDVEKGHGEISNVTLTLTTIIAIILGLLGLFLQISDVEIFAKYSFNQYALTLGLISGITHLNQVLTNIYRVYQKLFKIAFREFVTALSLLIVSLNFKDDALINALLIAMLISELFSLALFLIKAPLRISFSLDHTSTKKMLSVGIPLLIYNVSFYLIMVSARTILSIFYPVEAMGFYSLGNSITNATLLGLRSVVWVMFPTILSRTHEGIDSKNARNTVEKVNTLYSTSVFFVVFGMILLLPILFLALPQYRPAANTISVLLLSQAVLSAPFGYNTIAIARKKQLKVAQISMVAAMAVASMSIIVSLLKADFIWIALSVLFGSFVYTILQARLGSQTIAYPQTKINYLWDILPPGSILAILCFLAGSLSNFSEISGIIGLLIFSVSNRKRLKTIWLFIQKRIL